MISDTERHVYEKAAIPLILYVNASGEIRAELVSDGLCRVAGADRDAIVERLNDNLLHWVHPDDEEWMSRAIDNFFRKLSSFDVVFRNRIGHEGGYHMVHALGSWQHMADGTEAAVIVYAEMQDPEGKLGKLFSYTDHTDENLIYRDGVTGLPNLGYLRQFSNERLNILRACEKTPVLLYCDVKSLHAYNIKYGYTQGDELMKLLTELLKRRFPDAMVARGADDHFIIIDEYLDDERIVSKISAVNQEAIARAYGDTTGIHVGVCKVEPDVDAPTAVDCARQALMDIGDDLNVACRFYSHESNERRSRKRYIIESFEKALENGWIRVFYQGIVRAKSQKITVLEALARWVDPTYGMISPAEFIPVLSHYHQLYKLDLHMAEQICKEFGVRRENGLPLVPVTINFSAQDFDYVDIAEKLNDITDRHGVSRNSIIVEITEQDIAQATEHFKSQLRKIREFGYKLWIDDFGSGYSSLSVFSQFSIDRIKFDMELLRHLDDNNGANRQILRAFIGVCREMNVHTLAEGVETAEQLQFLKEIDCEMAQGFYFYEPMPLDVSIQNFENRTLSIPHETSEERDHIRDAWIKGGTYEGARLRDYVRSNVGRAIEEGWIKPYYQFINRTATGDACGEEALARWLDPELGELAPIQFIPALEEAELVHEVDMHIVDCVVADIVAKREVGMPIVPISVNLSYCDLDALDIVSEMVKRTDAHGIPHNLLRIEFSEVAVSSNPEQLKAQVKALREAGFEVWLDDFGSSRSSFEALREFDFDLIKLDGTFISPPFQGRSRDIVANVVQLTDKLGICTLAEGVETEEQVMFLRDIGCAMLQGFHYSKPQPLDAVIESFLQGVDFPREVAKEADYWRTISIINFANPSVDDEWREVDGTLLSEFPVSLMERRKGQLRRLRWNEPYRKFLESSGLATSAAPKSGVDPFRVVRDPYMASAIDRCSASGTWERVAGRAEFGTGFVFYVRPIASADDCEAFLAVATPTTLGTALGVYGDVPVGYAVYRVIFDEERTKAVDMEYVFANPTYCEWTGTTQEDIVGRSFVELYGDTRDYWLPYSYRAVALGEHLHDYIFSWDISHWISYYMVPSPVEDCCIFAYAFADDERRERQEMIVDRDTSDLIVSMVDTLNGEDSYDAAMNSMLETIGRIIRPSRLLIYETDTRTMSKTFEWNASGVSPRSPIGSQLPEKDYHAWCENFSSHPVIEVTNIEHFKSASMVLYNHFKNCGISRVLAVPLFDNGKLVGFLMAEDYAFDEGFDASRLLSTIASFIGARIASHRMVDELEWAGNHDALTGLLNRHGIDAAISELIGNKPNLPYALALLDIDDFKTLNDLYGHAIGDEALQAFANTMVNTFPKSAVVGRNGGDEFVVFIAGDDASRAEELLTRLSECNLCFMLDGKERRFSISIGYATYPEQAQSLESIYTKADAALYAVKMAGKNGLKRYAPELGSQYRYQLGFTPRDIAENIPGAIMVHRAGGDGEILFANDGMVELFECDDLPDFIAFTGGTIRNIVHPDDAVRMYEELIEQVSLEDVGAKAYVEYRVTTKTGKVKRVTSSGHLVDIEGIGKVFYVLLVDSDERIKS